MSKKALPVNIFQYHDYRTFLYDLYLVWKKKVYRLSYRKFSRMAGFTATNMLKQVIDGKRNLTLAGIRKITTVFDFNKQEVYFFENLVLMNQAKTHKAKNIYYTKLNKVPRYSILRKGDKNLYEFYSKWYYPVIRELVTTIDFRDDPSWIAKKIYPSITQDEARRALRVLEDMGQIIKVNGTWKQKEPLATTGPEVSSLAVANYHKGMIELAKSALEKVPNSKRNVTSLTLAISSSAYQTLVREIQSIQQRIINLANEETNPEHVYQVNFQVFPVTDFVKEEDT